MWYLAFWIVIFIFSFWIIHINSTYLTFKWQVIFSSIITFVILSLLYSMTINWKEFIELCKSNNGVLSIKNNYCKIDEIVIKFWDMEKYLITNKK